MKALESLLLVAAVCALLIVVVFPWVEPKLPIANNTVDGGASSSTQSPTPTATPPTSSVPTTGATDVPSGAPTGGTDVLPGD